MSFNAKKYIKYLKSDEGQKTINDLLDKRIRYYEQELNRVHNFTTKHEITRDLELKFVRFFNKQADFRFKHRKEISSTKIFKALMSYITKYGEKVSFESEDSLVGVWEWCGYSFKLYQGQGSHWRVRKDKREVYQTLL